MSSFLKRGAVALPLLVALAAAGQGTPYPGVGRTATAAEIAAWNIDVRPDFLGLPTGKGTVAQGQDLWEAKCASCHGVFGESNQIFNPLIGGTTKADVTTGRVARLTDPAYPNRTTLMKVATVSTLWDYINRAMPWTQPKSLKPDEVYALVAYMLHLGDVLPDTFELSDRNIAQAQARMPNRSGMALDHALWPGAGLARGKVDVRARACVTACGTDASVTSLLPDHARSQHGNLAEQSRSVGPQRGANTASTPSLPPPLAPTPSPTPAQPPSPSPDALALLRQHGCLGCHGMNNLVLGPSFNAVAARHGASAADVLTQKIRAGGVGAWGQIPMPAQALPEADARAIAEWISSGARP